MIKATPFMLHQPKFWQTPLKNDYLQRVHNLQADLVGMVSFFARICTSHLKVKQKANIVNCRWASFFGDLLVCFAVKPLPISWSSDCSTLIENLLAGATLYDLTQPSSTSCSEAAFPCMVYKTGK